MTRSSTVLVGCMALLAAGCGEGLLHGGVDNVARATPVPVVVSQGLALQSVIDEGVPLEALPRLAVATETAHDFHGDPFFHLTIIGPRAGAFWTVVDALHPDDAQADSYSLVISGASTARNTLSYVERGLGTLARMAAVRRAMGADAARAARVVAADAATILIADADGRLWDLDSAAPLRAEQVTELHQRYDLLRQFHRDNPELVENASEQWLVLLGEDQERQVAGLAPTSFADRDGQLDLGRALQTLQEARVQPAAPTPLGDGALADSETVPFYVNEQTKCEKKFLWFCTETSYAKRVLAPGASQPDYGTDIGNAQWASELGWHRARSFELWGLLGGYHGDMPIGCAPAAFMRLATWYQLYRKQTNGGALQDWYGLAGKPKVVAAAVTELKSRWNSAEASRRVLSHLMSKPVANGTQTFDAAVGPETVYTPELAKLMGTKAFGGGGLTTPGGLVSGANKWLAARATTVGQSHRLRGASFAIIKAIPLPVIGWLQWIDRTWKMADIVRSKIGRDNEPVIALYATGNAMGFEAHYRPVYRYKVHAGVTQANVLVDIKDDGFGGRTGMLSVTDFWSNYGGVFGLFPK